MNAVQRAVDELRFKIPRRVLEIVFDKQTSYWSQNITPMSAMIMNNVIYPRVLIDCDLFGGTEMIVQLKDATFELIENMHTVVRVPKSVTQGRRIISVLNVNFGSMFALAHLGDAAVVGRGGSGATMNAAAAAMNAHASFPNSSTARCQIIGENTVLVKNNIRLTNMGNMRCVIGNDESLSHLQLRSYPAFGKLVELAVKSYIYNEMITEMDIGVLRGGQEFSSIKDIISEYSDAEEMYQDYLKTKWAKISMMNDQDSFTRFLKLTIGSHR
jgi:hypothetical protein